MTTHTPGPWFVTHPAGEPEEPKGFIVSEHEPDTWVAFCKYDGREEINARLIAAAPELLASLKEVVDWIDNWSPSFIVDDEWPETADRFLAAIVKAEGR